MAAETTGDQDDATCSPTVPPATSPAWHNAVAGGVAGLSSRMATAPLDLIRIRRQLAITASTRQPSIWKTWRNIVEQEGGVTALFRGNVAAVYLWIGYSAVQFSLYNSTKDALRKGLQKVQQRHDDYIDDDDDDDDDATAPSSSLIAFVAGATAGSCATLATYPFDVCRTAFAARGKLMEQHALTTEAIPYSATNTASRISRPASPHMPFSSLVDPCYRQAGLVQPLPLSTTLEKSRAIPSSRLPPPPTSLLQFAKELYRQQGYRGFYAGVGPAIVQIIPYMGLNFTIYEYLTDSHSLSAPATTTVLNDHQLQQQHRLVMSSAYAGSISGAVSKILVYPLDTVKRRLQGQALSVLFVGSPSTTGIMSSDNGGSIIRRHQIRYRNMMHCMMTMYRHEGFFAFYNGLVPAVYKSTVATALSFAFFQWTKHALQNMSTS